MSGLYVSRCYSLPAVYVGLLATFVRRALYVSLPCLMAAPLYVSPVSVLYVSLFAVFVGRALYVSRFLFGGRPLYVSLLLLTQQPSYVSFSCVQRRVDSVCACAVTYLAL